MTFLLILFLAWSILVSVKLFHVFNCGRCRCTNRLTGRTIIVTGGNTGLGYETAKDLARRGAKVIIASDNYQDCVRAKQEIINHTGNDDVLAKHLDLGSLEVTRAFAKDILHTEERLDVLINNAGAIDNGTINSKDGLLLGLQVNYFGPFLMTILLIDLLKKTHNSRIINVTCKSAKSGQLDLENINSCPEKLGHLGTYHNSKLLMIYLTWELSEILKDQGVNVNCLNPGICNTDIYLKLHPKYVKKYCLIRNYFFAKTAEEGAQSSLHLAVSDKVTKTTGKYYEDCKPSEINVKKDLAIMKTVWDQSIKLVGLKPEEINI